MTVSSSGLGSGPLPVAVGSTPASDRRQPGGRAPAPGRLRLVQAFVNSFWDLDRGGEERLADEAALAGWLVEHDLAGPEVEVGAEDLRRALDVREGLRALMLFNNGATPDSAAIERLNAALRVPRLFAALGAGTPPELVVARRDPAAALASIAAVVAVAQLDGSWNRLKACRGEHCGWAFYDSSRNRSSTWCAMSVCGSRAKARDYRRRKRAGPPR